VIFVFGAAALAVLLVVAWFSDRRDRSRGHRVSIGGAVSEGRRDVRALKGTPTQITYGTRWTHQSRGGDRSDGPDHR
jgi:hypothetical protein